MSKRDISFMLFTVCCIAIPFFVSPIPQDPSFHNFADKREIFSIPNFYNVISNFPFLIVGLTGLLLIFRRGIKDLTSIASVIFFISVAGIALGSAYYHYNPSNSPLVWDRTPMSVAFMSFLSIIISWYVSKKVGKVLLFPLVVLGVISVLSWHAGELKGHGDLRLYLLVQFYPLVAVPFILFVYPASISARHHLLAVIFLYVAAKVFEAYDHEIFAAGNILSGHSIKHVFAAASIGVIVKMIYQLGEKNETAAG